MPFNVDKPPMRALLPNCVRVTARYQGGGAASDCTRLNGYGVTSVKYNAATGAYRITFDSVGFALLGGSIKVMNTAGTVGGQRTVNSSAYSAANKTMDIFVTDLATPTAKDLATTEELWIDLEWADTGSPT